MHRLDVLQTAPGVGRAEVAENAFVRLHVLVDAVVDPEFGQVDELVRTNFADDLLRRVFALDVAFHLFVVVALVAARLAHDLRLRRVRVGHEHVTVQR